MKRDQPEQRLQSEVASKLRFHLPSEIWWSASMSGIKLTPHLQRKAKGQGLNSGAPDLSFIFPDGVTRYVELKAAKGRPTPEQARLIETLSANIAVCRSWQDVESALSAWMAPYGLRFLTDAATERLQREVHELEQRLSESRKALQDTSRFASRMAEIRDRTERGVRP